MDKIEKFEIEVKKYNDTIKRNVATEFSINTLKKWISENVHKNLWLYDGLIFYGTTDYENNLVSQNEIWNCNGESFEHGYLFLGDADISWYINDITEKEKLENVMDI